MFSMVCYHRWTKNLVLHNYYLCGVRRRWSPFNLLKDIIQPLAYFLASIFLLCMTLGMVFVLTSLVTLLLRMLWVFWVQNYSIFYANIYICLGVYSINLIRKGKRRAFFLFLVGLEFELRVSHLLDRCFYHLSLSSSPFMLGNFKIRSLWLFSWTNF
jgi:hypothetical protein